MSEESLHRSEGFFLAALDRVQLLSVLQLDKQAIVYAGDIVIFIYYTFCYSIGIYNVF